MTQTNADFLFDNYDVILEIRNAETATKANKVKGDLLRILREEFLPGYSFTDDCGTCLFDMSKLLFRYYDQWKEEAKLFIETPPEPIEVKATFPSHKEVLTPVIPSKQENDKQNKKHHRK